MKTKEKELIGKLKELAEQEPDKTAERIILIKTCKSCPNVFPQIKGGYRCISLGINGYDLKKDIDTRCPLSTVYEYARQSQINLRDELIRIFRLDEPWNLIAIIEKLSEATGILLHEKDYDRHGWEEIERCWKDSSDVIVDIKEYLKQK